MRAAPQQVIGPVLHPNEHRAGALLPRSRHKSPATELRHCIRERRPRVEAELSGEGAESRAKIILSMESSPVLVLRLNDAARWPITCAGCAATGNRPGASSNRAPGRGFAAAQPAQIPGHRAAPLHQGKAASRRSGVVGASAESRE